MKSVLTISLLLVFVILGNVSYASTNDLNKKENNNEPSTKENLATPKLNKPTTQAQKPAQQPQQVVSPVEIPLKDTTNVNSVCKFNYIFYFIYKLKYDEKGQSTGYLEYDF